jgi:periplasmic protein TonB
MFESSLIDLETTMQPRRRWVSLPVAITIHFLALGSVTLMSYWNVAKVAEPPTNAVFFALPAPPPMIIRRGSPEPRSQAPRPPETRPVEVKPNQTVQPDLERIPERPAGPVNVIPPTVDVSGFGDPNGSDTGSEEGVPWGSEEGVPEGTGDTPGGTGTDPGGSAPPGPAEATRLTAEMTRPVPIHQVQPRYTEAARRAGVQGVVILEAIIDERGTVSNVRVLRGLPMGLEKEAVEAVKQWRYRPAMLNGRPVRVYFTLTVNFTIQR